MDHDAMDVAEARYELVISVDARRSGEYDDVDKPRMRARIYRVLEAAFTHAKVARDAVHMEDRGDGVLLAVAGRIAVTRLLGLWLVEVHENLRDENRALRVPLGLRVGMHVGPVRHDDRGISGRAVDLACRLADSPVARRLLDAERADLVLVVSDALYEDVVSSGGKFIEPAHYALARLKIKEGDVNAWFHLPGRPAPVIPAGDPPTAAEAAPADGPPPVSDTPSVSDTPPASETPSASDTPPASETDTPRAHYTVHGDMSQHSDNVYQQPVHIGRITEQRKG
ncbi:hypothetical protein [Streptomyces scopuliridis]|uniref:Guanylate cyclase domain-containing protein n=1 Tax=Streptomyces scopuliridis RB72 TaxID=1440053 RepID=A0A2T7SNS4_9ACTN|nr:hypothetical protein [Streptomyces scopuliridis]PVE04567.1 hypothetical protein Y717_11250 [Streptomyces scopuliridis RB72]